MQMQDIPGMAAFQCMYDCYGPSDPVQFLCSSFPLVPILAAGVIALLRQPKR